MPDTESQGRCNPASPLSAYSPRLQCDKATPSCSQCLKLGKECSGAVTGLVFLHANVNNGLSKTQKIIHARDPGKANARDGTALDSALSPQGSGPSSYPTIQIIREEMTPPSYNSSSHSASPESMKLQSRSHSSELSPLIPAPMDNSYAMTQLYISHWTAICQEGGLPWMSSLPSLLNRPSNPSTFAVERCVLASSLGYYGKLAKSKSMIMEAYKWYGFGLRKQRSQLQHFHPENRKPSMEEICLPIMLNLFEIICGTNLKPYFQHVMGAARMIEIRGPTACGSKELRMIFGTVRSQMVCRLSCLLHI
jgi:hypothetical protein